MDPTTLLSKLRDIHEPASIGAWPPAIGWWLLALIILATLGFTVWWLRRWYKKNAWRRAAIKEFKLIKQRYLASPSNDNLTTIVVLLKRCLASVRQDKQIRTLTGQSWKAQLDASPHRFSERELQVLAEGHYQQSENTIDASTLAKIENWIKRLKN